MMTNELQKISKKQVLDRLEGREIHYNGHTAYLKNTVSLNSSLFNYSLVIIFDDLEHVIENYSTQDTLEKYEVEDYLNNIHTRAINFIKYSKSTITLTSINKFIDDIFI